MRKLYALVAEEHYHGVKDKDKIMKAKAPEKIYLLDYNDAMVTPLEGDTIYVREDAFIEKACEWLRDNYLKYPNEDCSDTKRFVTDFAYYIKKGGKVCQKQQ